MHLLHMRVMLCPWRCCCCCCDWLRCLVPLFAVARVQWLLTARLLLVQSVLLLLLLLLLALRDAWRWQCAVLAVAALRVTAVAGEPPHLRQQQWQERMQVGAAASTELTDTSHRARPQAGNPFRASRTQCAAPV
jgi:hypothetical protein